MKDTTRKLKRIFIQVVIFLAIISPVILISLYSYIETKKTLTDTTFSLRQSAASLTSILVGEKLSRLIDVALSFSTRVQFRKLVNEGKWNEAIKILQGAPKDFPYIEATVLIRPDGTVAEISTDDKSPIGKSFAYRDWYKGVSKNWEPYVSEVFQRANKPKYNIIMVAVPIKTDDGEVIGILGVQVKLSTVLAWSQEVTVGSDGFIFIVDQNGHVAAHPHLDLDKGIIDYSEVQSVKYALSGQNGVSVVYNTAEHQERLAAYQKVPKYNWGVVATQSTKSAFVDRERSLQYLKSIYAGIFLLTCGLAITIVIILNKLRKSSEQMAHDKAKDDAMLTSIGDGVIFYNQNGNITFINQAATILLGWPQGEIIGKDIGSVIPIEDIKNVSIPNDQRPLKKALSEKVKNTGDYFYIKKDGSKLPITLTVSPVILNNSVIGVIEIFKDVTHERQVDKMKTEFISLASHQLRTPLTAMKWFLEMLLAGDTGALNAEQKEFVTNINLSNERMIGLVNSLLNVSRIESGRIMVNPVPTDLKELLHGVEVEIENKLKEKEQTLILSINENLPKVNLDPQLIRQVYMNLLTNSIKYTPKGGEIIVLVSRKGEELLSQVTDNGYGIPANDHDKIFQKFYRGENIIKLETDGNGLGIYLVKAIIDSSKGEIWFESSEGKGTTFWFSLPITGMIAKKGEVTIGG